MTRSPTIRVPAEWLFLGLAVALGWFSWRSDDSALRGFPVQREVGDLRVMTWNVGEASGTHGNPLRDTSVKAVIDTIRRSRAELVFLQELQSRSQLRGIVEGLGGEPWRSATSGEGQRILGVLGRGSLTARSVALSRGRDALQVVYQAGSQAVLAVSLHADAFSAKKRNLQIGEVMSHLEGRHQRWPTLLVGDFNLDLDLDKRRDLFSNDEYRDVESYNLVTQELHDAGLGKGATAEPDRRLDYVFYHPAHLRLQEAGPLSGSRFGSMDHDPLVADFSWESTLSAD